jgi:plasmid stabilization system protein ParE
MTRILLVSALAESDLADAADWYNRILSGLGDDFVLCVELALDRILEHPEAFTLILPAVRRALVRRFPYGVFFRLRHERIEIEAVFHLRADPARFPERLA